MESINNTLLEIAKQTIFCFKEGYRKDFETKGNDDEDFLDITVWDLYNALESAYKAGYNEGWGDCSKL